MRSVRSGAGAGLLRYLHPAIAEARGPWIPTALLPLAPPPRGQRRWVAFHARRARWQARVALESDFVSGHTKLIE